MKSRVEQIKYYQELLKEDEILLLKSKDEFYFQHYSNSPLSILTNFSGSCGEAIIEKSGKITLFVDTRYHLLAQKIAYKDIQVYNLDFGETFFDAFKKLYKKNTVLYLDLKISFADYKKYSSYFDIRTYNLKQKFASNDDIKKDEKIVLADKTIEKIPFLKKIEKFKKANLDYRKLLIFDLNYIAYLTNLRSYKMKYNSAFPAILYVDFDSSNYILFSDFKIDKIEGLKYLKLADFKNFIQSQETEIVINSDDITLENFLAIKKPKEGKFKNFDLITSIKTIEEIDHLTLANKKIDFAISNFKKRLKFGLNELELKNILEEEILNTKAKALSFKTILAVDENTASIHYSDYDKNRIITDNSLILLDCGAYFDAGLATDITRTIYFGPRPKDIYKKVYTYVIKAFIQCFLSDIKEAKKLDELARKILKPMEVEGFYFNHGLGHGIGTNVHQNPPVLNPNSIDTIKPYQVHSIEPGLYGRDENGVEFGVRFENCVYYDINYKRYSLSRFPFEEKLINYELLDDIEKEFIKNWNRT